MRDTMTAPPQLLVYAHSWGLLELPRGRPAWSFEEALGQVVAAGFQGVQAEPERGREILDAGLRFAAGGRAQDIPGIDALVSRSADAGAHCLTMHLGWGDEDDDAADRLVIATLDAAQRHAIPVFIETHRATVVQDLWRTNRIIERNPQIRFNGDYSHYYVAHEVPYRGFASFRQQIKPVLERTAFFHGRVSNGQCIQVSIADPAQQPHLENFRVLWRAGMQHWRQHAGPGDVLPFVPELGPPSAGYAITLLDESGTRREIADRWRETLQLKAIAEELWHSLEQ
jgi:hypothetical protein